MERIKTIVERQHGRLGTLRPGRKISDRRPLASLGHGLLVDPVVAESALRLFSLFCIALRIASAVVALP